MDADRPSADEAPRVETLSDLRDELSALHTHVTRTLEPSMVTREDLERALVAHRERGTTAFTHDNLPHPALVKDMWLRLRSARQPLAFEDVAFGILSQNGEDGILMYILSVIGMRSYRCVEVGCDLSGSSVGVPECSTGNLILNFSFDGLVLEKDEAKVGAIGHFFSRALTTRHFHRPRTASGEAGPFSPRILAAEVMPATLNELVAKAGYVGEVDVYSQDFDGPDVETWRRLDAIDPRVVMVEINSRIPFTDVVHGTWSTSTAPPETLEYQASSGSSLAAACEVADEKGYVFVGLDPTLLNAFFVRRDEWVPDMLPERRAADYAEHRFSVLHRIGAR